MDTGRVALVAILTGLRSLSNRRQVIVPAYSCPTVVQAVIEAGLEPTLCDVSVRTLDLDREALRALISDEVLAIIPAHLYGLAQDVRDLLEIGHQHGIFVIEDAAQAFGAKLDGKMIGTFGDAGMYSLGRGKCIPVGHGGVIVSRECCSAAILEVAQETISDGTHMDLGSLVLFAGYGMAIHPRVWWLIARTPLNPADHGMDLDELAPIRLHGLSAVRAALGNSILERLEAHQSTSRSNAQRLMAGLAEFDGISFPEVPPGAEPVYLRLPVLVENEHRANRLFDLLQQEGIGVSRSYWRSLPDLFSEILFIDERDFPGAARLARCLLTLPTHTYLQEQDLARIQRAFARLANEGG
jgi:dTDP-4-amino-4,6-dideoxygalactose transaminase